MSALTATLVIDGETTTSVMAPPSWPGFVCVWVTTADYFSPIQLYVSEDKARELVEQLTAALAVKA